MKKLVLLRHGKSDWSDPASRDFDRPINQRGAAGSQVVGKWIAQHGLQFDLLLASPAVRVVETIEQAAPFWGQEIEPHWDRRIYLASSVTLMDVLRDAENNPDTVLMVGHNPGLEDLIFDLVPENPECAMRARVEDRFPTAAIAVIELAIERWDRIDNRCGRLVQLAFPVDLDPNLGPENND